MYVYVYIYIYMYIRIYVNIYIYIYIYIYIQCDELENLLDEKGIQYNYLDMAEMPHKAMINLRM